MNTPSVEFVLYVVGLDGPGGSAVARFQEIFGRAYGEDYELTVVDIATDPQRAETDGIVATPTLIRQNPQPRRRFVGYPDSDRGVQAMLGLPTPQPH